MLAFYVALAAPEGPVGPRRSGEWEGVVEGNDADAPIGLEAAAFVIDAAQSGYPSGVAFGVDDDGSGGKVFCLDVVRHMTTIP